MNRPHQGCMRRSLIRSKGQDQMKSDQIAGVGGSGQTDFKQVLAKTGL